MIAPKIKQGDEIRVIAPSRSLACVWAEKSEKALAYLESQGFKVSFSKHSREMDEWQSSSIQSRVSTRKFSADIRISPLCCTLFT